MYFFAKTDFHGFTNIPENICLEKFVRRFASGYLIIFGSWEATLKMKAQENIEVFSIQHTLSNVSYH